MPTPIEKAQKDFRFQFLLAKLLGLYFTGEHNNQICSGFIWREFLYVTEVTEK